MNTPWPKLSTSIRPKTSVRPEAMMKMIMPIARPATVSVTQVEGEPIERQRGERQRDGSSSGSQSTRRFGSAAAAHRSAATFLRAH